MLGKSHRLFLLWLIGFSLAAFPVVGFSVTNKSTCAEEVDWMDAQGEATAPVKPADCAIAQQTPPDFIWPNQGKGTIYQLDLRFPNKVAKNFRLTENWLSLNESLPPGDYTWQIIATTPNKTPLKSRVRRFTVSKSASEFIVPNTEALYKKISSAPRPRAFPKGQEREQMLLALQNERAAAFKILLTKVANRMKQTIPVEPPERADTQKIQSKRVATQRAIQNTVYNEERGILDVAFAWMITQKPEYLAETKRRALNVAKWDPQGATGLKSQDQATRSVAWTLALVYDWLYENLSEQERKLILASVAARQKEMFEDVIDKLPVTPLDAHANHTVGKVAAISAILAGEVTEAKVWFNRSIPLHVNLISPWGGEDGGYANGTAYAQWDIGELIFPWDTLRWSTGIDVFKKAYLKNFGNYLAYFLPPGSPSGTFGDASERVLKENWARYAKAYGLRARTPLSNWYMTQFSGEDASAIMLLLAPRGGNGAAPFPNNVSSSAIFPSIGWVAMHSELADLARTSIYFKSSPYGSHNHSHSDQNSFVIHSKGKPLAIDSGYYDWYHSPHWTKWTKQTIAHNAITYDGGKGQLFNVKSASGKIVNFIQDKDYQIVTGDAVAAYGGALTKAIRSLVYVRPNTVIVFDSLASAEAHSWEWNVHAVNQMERRESGTVVIRNGDASLCIDTVGSQALEFNQTNQFNVPPSDTARPNQWHGAFVMKAPSKSATFASVLRLKCIDEKNDFSLKQLDGNRWQVAIGRKKFEFDDASTTVK